jgi:tetratricopeptide (TPR) repeat protein
MRKYDQAITDFDQALKLDPTKADALRNRGSSSRAKGELDLALADYDGSLRNKPDNATVYSDRDEVWR